MPKDILTTESLLAIIARHLGEDAAERLTPVLDDPTADLTPGQCAILGGALSSAGAAITNAARDVLYGVRQHEEEGVVFSWRDPLPPRWRVKTATVKELFPQTEYPDLYHRDKGRTGYVVVDLPWKT